MQTHTRFWHFIYKFQSWSFIFIFLSRVPGFVLPHVACEQWVWLYLCLSLSHGFVFPHVDCEQWVCILPVFEFESWFRMATCCLWAVRVCFTCVWVMVSYGHTLSSECVFYLCLSLSHGFMWPHVTVSSEGGFTCVWVWVMVSYGHMLPVSSECVFYLCLSFSHGSVWSASSECGFTCVWVWLLSYSFNLSQ